MSNAALRMAIGATIQAKSGAMKSRFKSLMKSSDYETLKAVISSVLAIHANAVRLCATSSTGIPVTRYKPKRQATASLPGNPPNRDTGLFVRSIQFEVDESEKTGYVGTNDPRGPWFEFGTKNMQARPWLTPALQMSQDAIKEIFKKMKLRID